MKIDRQPKNLEFANIYIGVFMRCQDLTEVWKKTFAKYLSGEDR